MILTPLDLSTSTLPVTSSAWPSTLQLAHTMRSSWKPSHPTATTTTMASSTLRDYVVWRAGFGTKYDMADYQAWRANFGRTISSGVALMQYPSQQLCGCCALQLSLARYDVLCASTFLRHIARGHINLPPEFRPHQPHTPDRSPQRQQGFFAMPNVTCPQMSQMEEEEKHFRS